MTTETVKGKYDNQHSFRDPYLSRGRECAKLTIPALLPDQGHTASSKFSTPKQSLGARAVNNLSSKLLIALFPPNRPFFRLSPNEADLKKAEAETKDDQFKTKLEKQLKEQEQIIVSELENTPFRSAFFEALKHLVVVGNVLINLQKTGKVRVFPLDRYVVRRDPSGNILEIITKESVDLLTLSPQIIKTAKLEQQEKDKTADPVDVYTHIRQVGDMWEVIQEINEVLIPETKGTYPLDALPYLPLRFIRVDGENYGRSLVEEYYGDLVSVEGLRTDILEAAAIAAKCIFLVSPNSSTNPKDLAKAENGDFVVGNQEDVAALQIDKQADMAIAENVSNNIMSELAKAFLLNSSVSRDAERVTAEEIRYMARELEDTLGGVYSILTQEMQLPFVRILIHRLTKSQKLKSMPDTIKPRILTGLEALGRTDERERMLMFLQDVAMLGQEGIARLNKRAIIDKLGNQHQIDIDGLLIDEEEYQQGIQQQQMMAMATQVAPNVVDGVMKQGTQQ